MSGCSGYRWYTTLGRHFKVLHMEGSVTKGLVGIVKVGQQLWKACKPIGATFRGIKGIVKP
jgi:hypothetical protein